MKEYISMKTPFMLIFEDINGFTNILFFETEEELIEMGKEIKNRGGNICDAMEIASYRTLKKLI